MVHVCSGALVLAEFTYFGLTFKELHSFWVFEWRQPPKVQVWGTELQKVHVVSIPAEAFEVVLLEGCRIPCGSRKIIDNEAR